MDYVDRTEGLYFDPVRDGLVTVSGVDGEGRPLYALTAEGVKRLQELLSTKPKPKRGRRASDKRPA